MVEKSYDELKVFWKVFQCALCIFKYQKHEQEFWDSVK